MIAIDDTTIDPPDSGRSPDADFDRRWASTVLSRALDALQGECEQNGNADLFEHVRPWLVGDATHGDRAKLAAELRMEPNTLKSHVSRLRKRFQGCVRDEVARTRADPGQTEDEMRSLLAALQKK